MTVRQKEALLNEVCMEARSQIAAPSALLDVTAHYAAPVLYGFGDWLVRTAVSQGTARLYFLARDGYWPWKIASILCRTRKLPLECRYLYASRRAWRTPCFHFLGEEGWEQLFQPGYRTSLETVFARLGLEEEARLAAGITVEESRRLLSPEEVNRWRCRLEGNPRFRELVSEVSQKSYWPAVEYLRQQGVLDGEPVAIADTGWTGSMQRSLRQLMESAACTAPVTGYYFGLYRSPRQAQDGQSFTWFFGPESPVREKAAFNNNVLEILCAAPHGMTVGYQEQNGRFDPVFAPGERPAELDSREKILLDFCRRMEQRFPHPDPVFLLRESRKRMKRLCVWPDRKEAEAFSRLSFCDDVSDGYPQPMTRPVSRQEARRYRLGRRFFHRKEPMEQPLFWPGGSFGISPLRTRRLYQLRAYLWDAAWHWKNRKG